MAQILHAHPLLHLRQDRHVTVLKDRATHRSHGVAFVQFVSQPDALWASVEMHGKILNGRKVAASIAIDNGRAPEFIWKRVYKDKSRRHECGEDGHLSYECPKNVLGSRERPAPKKGRRGSREREEWCGIGGGGHGGGRDDEREDLRRRIGPQWWTTTRTRNY